MKISLIIGPKYFTPYQIKWKDDTSRLRICVKSRQVGMSYVDAYDSVLKAAMKRGRDVWVMSRDEVQAHQYFLHCKRWARILKYAATDFGEQIFTMANGKPVKVSVLTFASGASIYTLSSNPDAIVGKSGHVKLDEFALHKDQRTLYAVAKPVIQWGGTLSIISTHRGISTVFNQILRDIKERHNPMGWSLHEIPIDAAVAQGLVQKINAATGASDAPEEWMARQHAECIDEEQWKQEYCCVPADESAAFITHQMITTCEDTSISLMTLDQFLDAIFHLPSSIFYLGMDVARKRNLCVIDVGEKIGDVVWDRLRIELHDKPFSEIKANLYPLLRLPQLHRACIDASGLGTQLAEEAKDCFGWKVEPITFTAPLKEEMAFGLRRDFEDCKLRLVRDDKLRSDLRGLKKLVTPSGNIRFAGEVDDSHCDRTWAKALRQYAARNLPEVGAMVG
jgi:phage FluMu gp28-like protein